LGSFRKKAVLGRWPTLWEPPGVLLEVVPTDRAFALN
jgi:hypothetical protein